MIFFSKSNLIPFPKLVQVYCGLYVLLHSLFLYKSKYFFFKYFKTNYKEFWVLLYNYHQTRTIIFFLPVTISQKYVT